MKRIDIDLMNAIFARDAEAVQSIINKGGNVNATTPYGTNLFERAVGRGNNDSVIAVMRKNGARLPEKNHIAILNVMHNLKQIVK